MKFIKIAIVIGLAYFGYSVFASYKAAEEGVKYAGRIIPLLNEISSDWRIGTLKKNIDPMGYDGNKGLYKKMLHKSSHLGAFDKCEGMSVGTPKDLNIEGAKAVVGDCKFRNGTANVAVIFLEFEGELRVMSVIVKPEGV